MIPLSVEYAIREAVALLRASRRHFKSHQIETARELLEKCLEDLPERKAVLAAKEAGHSPHSTHARLPRGIANRFK